MTESNFSISIRPIRIICFLGSIIILLILASMATSVFILKLDHNFVHGFVPKFNLDMEANVPTYFSSILLLISSALLGIIANIKKKERDLYSLHWLILSVIFLLMSADEVASVHELFTEPIRDALGLSGFLYYSWVVGGMIFILLFAIFYFKFLFSLPSRAKYQFSIAAVCYIGGAIGMEFLGGFYVDAFGGKNMVYATIMTFEESMEMIGILIFIDALLRYIKENIPKVTFSFE